METGVKNGLQNTALNELDAQGGNLPNTILKARIALLATAIGGVDHTSEQQPAPYKLGDDCLACLKDLKRWFTLVDDRQKRWDVASAAAEFKILVDDLVPIMLEWEYKSVNAIKKCRKTGEDISAYFKNKGYYDKVVLNALQLIVWMTWPIILNDDSSENQIQHYATLKKHLLTYKKAILHTDGGKVIKAAIRIATDVIKIDKVNRTALDNSILRLVLDFIRNVLAIEPAEITISMKQKSSSRGIGTTEMLPPNTTLDDISLDAVILAFRQNKVFDFLLALGSSMNREFDASYIKLPLLEISFYLTKNVSHKRLFGQLKKNTPATNSDRSSNLKGTVTRVGEELTDLLTREHNHKRSQIRTSSTRHSRFGGFFSIQTSENVRLTVPNASNVLDNDAALTKLDKRKKWSKAVRDHKDLIQGIPTSFLNSDDNSSAFLTSENVKYLRKYLDNFMESSFNTLWNSITDLFTMDDDQVIVHKIQLLLVFAWYVKYNRYKTANKHGKTDATDISETLRDTTHILLMKFLREAYEQKNWAITHAGILAVTELFTLLWSLNEEWAEDVEVTLSRLLSEERIKLLSDLPKSASNHSPQYIWACIHLNSVIFKILDMYEKNKKDLTVRDIRKRRSRKFTDNIKISKHPDDVKNHLIEEKEDLSSQESDTDAHSNLMIAKINFNKVRSSYVQHATIDTYINFLQRYEELDDEDIKIAIQFLYFILVQAKEDTFLFRIDLMILLKDMLGLDGLNRNSRNRADLEQFTNYLMKQLKEKLKKSPSWFVNLLFPNIRDRELGYYMRYGEQMPTTQSVHQVVIPTRFKNIEGQEQMTEKELRIAKFGILVSTLIDEGKEDYVKELSSNLEAAIEVYREYSTRKANELEGNNYPRFDFSTSVYEMKRSLLFDSDLRALFLLVGYHIPNAEHDKCYIEGDLYLEDLQNNLDLLNKYKSVPFVTPNGLASSSYLFRPINYGNVTVKTTNNDDFVEQDMHDFIDDEDRGNSDDYFRDLDRMDERLVGRDIIKGTAKAKTVKKLKAKGNKKKHKLPLFDTGEEGHIANENEKKRKQVVSSQFITDFDSDIESFENSTFYENEMYLRYLLDKYNGQLPTELFSEFARFASERTNNNGKVKGDYSVLFGGQVPTLSELESLDSAVCGQSLKGLVDHQLQEASANFSPNHDDANHRPFKISKNDMNISDNEELLLSASEYDTDSSSEGTTYTAMSSSRQSESLESKTKHRERSLSPQSESDEEYSVTKRRRVRVALSDEEET
ncbi:HCL610Wp [Eremothecium sinecaudum]|uniref:Topoisomerase 1-associated factor 1 n=1 Tax=Eremothecium sinecaudum TaxID=45286 RepID=A0A109UXU5_9SACH|nr:HCL610Wp [Eremothecium sinecaudum]AMD19541.1 HCL610Wp [Eremothecium sinecaudum]